MAKEARLQQMLSILEHQDRMTADQLSQTLFVSLPTIYRDLRELSRRKLIIRNGGHVQRAQTQTVTTPIDFRRRIHMNEKIAIARAAARLIQDHTTIFLDASTTVSYLIEELKSFRDLTVLTNGLVTALLLKRAGIRTYCLGGSLVDNSLAVVGQQTLLRHFEIDTMLFSAYGVNSAGMIVDPSEEETGLRRYIMRHSRTSVLLCDQSKFGKNSPFNVAPLQKIDYLVTDAQLSPAQAPVKRKIIIV